MDSKVLDRYNSAEGAEDYLGKFKRRWTERINDRNERKVLRGLIRAAGIGRVPGLALDLPCGYGRLYPLAREVADRVVEGDWSFPLLSAARGRETADASLGPAFGYVRGTALCLPFRDGAFDFVLSVRLCHHIDEREERLLYLREILRVSARWVVFTYFDETSLKNRIREFNRRRSGKRPKSTLHPAEVARAAREQGFEVVRTVWLARLFSGHRYVALRRVGDTPPPPGSA
jgi:SAM-dependent methyltransferase